MKMRLASRLSKELGRCNSLTDRISTPCDTLIDQILVTSAMQNMTCGLKSDQIQDIAVLFKLDTVDLIYDYRTSRQYTPVHTALLGLQDSRISLNDFLDDFLHRSPDYDIDTPDAFGRTPLAWAVEYGWLAATKTLLCHGANAAQMRPCKQGLSPLLHLLIAAPSSDRFETEFLEVIRLLVIAGADINATDSDGWTPLHVAASWNLASAIKALITIGEDRLNFDARTNDGQSVMDLALLDNNRVDEVIQLLDRRRLSPEDEEHWFRRFSSMSMSNLDEIQSPTTDQSGDDEDVFFEAEDSL